MRAISEKRKLIEKEPHKHIVKRGYISRIHFENLPILRWILNLFLQISLTRAIGAKNAMDVRTEEIEITFDNLPPAFHNTRILLITDPHIDKTEKLTELIAVRANELDYDYCILGGDYSFDKNQKDSPDYSKMIELTKQLIQKSRIFAVLGNHDKYNVAQALDDCGVEVLINESLCIEKDGDKIYLAGLDDCHYYQTDDIDLADSDITAGAFKIMLSHSPERYAEAAAAGYSLYLAGHTHGGQICLPGSIAVVTSSAVPRSLVKGQWQYQKMKGYTSRGVGSSGVPVRYFCPPEITVITLKLTNPSPARK